MGGHWRELLRRYHVRADAVVDGFALHKQALEPEYGQSGVTYRYLHAHVSIHELETAEQTGTIRELLDSLDWK